ncbi:ribosome maturation factor RimP [Thermodesulfobacteriota bacterium]
MSAIAIEKIIEFIEPFLSNEGYELVDAEMKNEQMGWTLRVYIDKEDGVNVDDCANISREMGNLLEVEDIIPHKYHLEISSPGLNRPLRKREHFLKVVGERVKVKAKLPVEGGRNFKATLAEVTDSTIKLDYDQKSIEVSLDNIEKANLIYNFK